MLVPFREWEILLVMGTTEADVSAESWPSIRAGQAVLETAFAKASAAEATELRDHLKMLAILSPRSKKLKVASRRILDLLAARTPT